MHLKLSGQEGKAASETAARRLLNKNNPVNDFWSSFNSEEEEEKIRGFRGELV